MRLPLTKRRKVGTTSNHHAPYDLGYTRTTMAVNREKRNSDVEQNSKNGPSSDCRLKLKGIDGGPHKQWSMWFNSKQREEPYQVLTSN